MSPIVYMVVFFAIGITAWALSLKFPAKAYGKQPIEAKEWLIGLVSIAFIVAYDQYVARIVINSWEYAEPFTGMVYDWFYVAHPLTQFVCMVVLADFMTYWAHRFLHSRWMWRFHAFHHAPKKLNWVTGMRGSPVHYIVLLFPSTSLAFMLLSSGNRWIALTIMITDPIVQHFLHTSIHMPYARSIERFFITPRVHFVHHHPNPRYTNSNYASVFSLWDRWFGTFTDPDSVEEGERGKLGLDYEQNEFAMLIGLKKKDSPEELRRRERLAA